MADVWAHAAELERGCGPAADGGWRCAPYAACTHPGEYAACTHPGGCLLGDLADPEPAGDRGPVVPIAPDPDRDARVAAYRERERRRAARALDRYFTSMHSDSDGDPFVAGERFVEQVGDYVLARLDGMLPDGFHVEINTDPLQHNGDYGATPVGAPVCSHGYQIGVRGQHIANNQPCTDNTPKSHYGVPPCTCDEPSGMNGCEQHMPVKLRTA